MRNFLLLFLAAGCCLAAQAQATFRNPDEAEPNGESSAVYPVPYHQVTPEEITAELERVRGYLETKAFNLKIDHGRLSRGDHGAFGPFDYTTGVIHTGMLRAAAATGDARFKEFTARHLQFLADNLPKYANAGGERGNPLHTIYAPAALDDCGSMCASLIRARLDGVGPDLLPVIQRWGDFVAHRQYRLPDHTLARQRPQPVSIWADDLYMGVEPLALMGKLTGDRVWLDDAARDTLQTAQRLWRPELGLFAHGWSEDSPNVPDFYWGRANGWAMVTLCDLLDVLPPDHPRRPAILDLLRKQIKAVASLQSGHGLWHQLLDRSDSYLETSCSAMFTYGIAHAINQGWIVAPTYGPIAQAGWIGVATQITAEGQVDHGCIGTTYAGDMVYYYHRPANAYAPHNYGPTLLAGAEMIALLRNPAFHSVFKNQAYHYVPTP